MLNTLQLARYAKLGFVKLLAACAAVDALAMDLN
jgi:hypothetical protein